MQRLPGLRQLRVFAWHLRRPTRWSAVRSLFDAVIVSYTLKTKGVGVLTQPRPSTATTTDAVQSRQVAKAVDAAFGLLPIAPTCLRRSVTLVRELRRLGLEATTHVGVLNNDGRIEAHAWVQVDGEVVNDDPRVTTRYAQLLEARWDELIPIMR